MSTIDRNTPRIVVFEGDPYTLLVSNVDPQHSCYYNRFSRFTRENLELDVEGDLPHQIYYLDTFHRVARSVAIYSTSHASAILYNGALQMVLIDYGCRIAFGNYNAFLTVFGSVIYDLLNSILLEIPSPAEFNNTFISGLSDRVAENPLVLEFSDRIPLNRQTTQNLNEAFINRFFLTGEEIRMARSIALRENIPVLILNSDAQSIVRRFFVLANGIRYLATGTCRLNLNE